MRGEAKSSDRVCHYISSVSGKNSNNCATVVLGKAPLRDEEFWSQIDTVKKEGMVCLIWQNPVFNDRESKEVLEAVQELPGPLGNPGEFKLADGTVVKPQLRKRRSVK